jgi:hypothetical protein
MRTTTETADGLSELTALIQTLGTWSPWLVMALILLLYMNQQGKSQERKNDNLGALITFVGKVQDKSDENEASIKSLSAVNADVVKTNGDVVAAVNELKTVTSQGSDELRKALKETSENISKIAGNYVDTTRELSDIFDNTGKKIFGALDAMTTDIKGVPQQTLAGIVPMHDDLVKRLSEAFANAASQVFDGCIEENKRLTEENDLLKRKVAAVSQTGILPIVLDTTPDPEPPTPPSPDHKAALPDNVDIIVALPRVDGEEKAAA